jgi:hypothetical protein
MTKLITCTIVAAVAALPLAAGAQQPQGDAAYCSALAQQYERYVSGAGFSRRGPQRDVTVDAAIAHCPSASAISTIEQALRNAKVELPPHG